MTDTFEKELWIAWNEDDDAVADFDSEGDCADRFDSEVGGYVRRMVKIKLTLPKATVPEAAITIEPDQAPQVETS